MAIKNHAYYRGLVQSALADAGISEPPVPVELVAERLGLPVRPVVMPVFFSGAVINEDGLPVMLVSASKDEMGRRRVLAHMLGHILAVLDDPAETYPRNTDLEHESAEICVQEFIMPENLILDQARKWFNDYRYLARLFGVDEQEMLNKMVDLGIIKHRTIQWDY
ncbi:MAG: ImmA/IrrE family metallo-endopeptidase [Actinomycetota bacterium]|nr:ImmA/IrrE family metallo-endopeptidase [Actinomycetota bacterium]